MPNHCFPTFFAEGLAEFGAYWTFLKLNPDDRILELLERLNFQSIHINDSASFLRKYAVANTLETSLTFWNWTWDPKGIRGQFYPTAFTYLEQLTNASKYNHDVFKRFLTMIRRDNVYFTPDLINIRWQIFIRYMEEAVGPPIGNYSDDFVRRSFEL